MIKESSHTSTISFTVIFNFMSFYLFCFRGRNRSAEEVNLSGVRALRKAVRGHTRTWRDSAPTRRQVTATKVLPNYSTTLPKNIVGVVLTETRLWCGPGVRSLRRCLVAPSPCGLPENTCVAQVTHRWGGKSLSAERRKGEARVQERPLYSVLALRLVIDLSSPHTPRCWVFN